MALSKERKKEVLTQYVDWLNRSQAIILTEYSGLSVKDISDLRATLRESGGEFHIIKNTLGKLAFKEVGREFPDNYFLGTTAVGFAFHDAPALAKAIADFSKGKEFVKIKGGYLGEEAMSADQIKALADLPPLPIVRAQFLSTLLAPANKLARILLEPSRQIAQVLQANLEKDAASAPA